MLQLNSLNVGAKEPAKLAAFYEQVFAKKPDWEESGWYGFSIGPVFLSIGAHDKVTGQAQEPYRVMFNLETEDVKAEFVRIKKLGAKVIAEPYNMDENDKESFIATFADPEGNYFQLMPPWKG